MGDHNPSNVKVLFLGIDAGFGLRIARLILCKKETRADIDHSLKAKTQRSTVFNEINMRDL